MGYFKELPDLEYPSFLPDKKSSRDYLEVKNFFRRVKLREDLKNNFILLKKYQIPDGVRPDLVAEEFYGKADYDWIVILSAGIINIKDEWPLSDRDLYTYTERKYGITGMYQIHHYETIEIRDLNGRLILPKGQVVDANFRIPNPYQPIVVPPPTPPTPPPSPPPVEPSSNLQNTQYVGVTPVETIRYTTSTINPVTAVTNYDYETIKNNEKRTIGILNPVYLQQFLNDMRSIMSYDINSQYVDDKLIRAKNTRLTGQ